MYVLNIKSVLTGHILKVQILLIVFGKVHRSCLVFPLQFKTGSGRNCDWNDGYWQKYIGYKR